MTEHRLHRPGAVDLVFQGELLAEVSSRHDPGKADPRFWTEIRIFRTNSGRYVTQVVGRSASSRFRDRVDVRVLDRPGDVKDALRRYDRKTGHGYHTDLAIEALELAAERDTALAALAEERI